MILLTLTINATYKTINAHQQAGSLALLQAQASQSQRYWLAMLTHEIKTPLSVINASCQSMELLRVEPAIQTRIDKIKRNVARIDDLVKRFLRNDEVLARLQHLQCKLVELNSWLPTQLQLFDEKAQKRWRLKIESNLVIFADVDLLAVALSNLLANALKYSQENSPIEITVQFSKQQNKGGILISVKDYGVPISNEKRRFLFSRNQLNEYVGNSIGLWACREIARAHLGDVWLDENQLNGNTFNIWLP
jgi:signal transduction histidine kinase